MKRKKPTAEVYNPVPPPTRPDLHGHKAIAANICYQCGGVLKNSEGRFCETVVETRSSAFAAAICHKCKPLFKQEEQLGYEN